MKIIKKTYPFEYNWSEKQFFIYACFVDDLEQFYKDWIDQKKDRIQFFNIVNDKLEHKYWKPGKICCDSFEILTKENIEVKISYWLPNLWKPIHKDLKQTSMQFEAFECQKIDCSCNDCIFLDRPNSYCKKLDKKTIINTNMCHIDNQNCFKHRKE